MVPITMLFFFNLKTLCFLSKVQTNKQIHEFFLFEDNKISPWLCVRVYSVMNWGPVSFPLHPKKYQKSVGKVHGAYLCLERPHEQE